MAASTKDHLGARVSKGKRQVYVDAAAAAGLTLNVWVERTLDAALSEAEGPVLREQAAPGPVDSSESARAAASHRAPVLTSSEAKRDVKPIPKGGK